MKRWQLQSIQSLLLFINGAGFVRQVWAGHYWVAACIGVAMVALVVSGAYETYTRERLLHWQNSLITEMRNFLIADRAAMENAAEQAEKQKELKEL